MKVYVTNCTKKNKLHLINLIADAFKLLGHTVFEFDYDDYGSQYLLKWDQLIKKTPLSLFRRYAQLDLREKYRTHLSNEWLRTIKEFKPDVLLLINTGFVSSDAIRRAKEELHVPHIVSWVVDDLSRTNAEDSIAGIPYCDTVFVVDEAWAPFLKIFNPNVSYLPLAASDACYKPLHLKRETDAAFVGSFFRKSPEGFLRSFVLSCLPAHLNVHIYGPGIDYYKHIYPRLSHFKCYDKHISVIDVNEVYNRSKLAINVNSPQVIRGTAPRLFETALSGTLQIVQYTPAVAELFPGVTVPTFRSIPELTRHVEYYLSHEKEREALAAAMFRIAKEKHLYTHRVKTMLVHMGLH